MDNITKGKKGEQLAVKFLKNLGYKIIENNFKVRYGEIDIIALEGNTLVFIEVKTRNTHKYGRPEETISSRKLLTIIQTAQHYKLLHPELPELLRIDVVAINKVENQINLFKNVSG